MWRTFSTTHGGCFPLHGSPGPAWPATPPVDGDVERPAPGLVAVPDLTGMTSQDARRCARFAELSLSLAQQPTSSGLRGRVMRQHPAPGALVRPGEAVQAYIGVRPGVAVPDVRGLDEQDGLNALRAAGLNPSRRVERRSSSVGQGLLVRTRPRAGAEVPVGTRVAYVIAAEPRPRAVTKRAARRSQAHRSHEPMYLSMPLED